MEPMDIKVEVECEQCRALICRQNLLKCLRQREMGFTTPLNTSRVWCPKHQLYIGSVSWDFMQHNPVYGEKRVIMTKLLLCTRSIGTTIVIAPKPSDRESYPAAKRRNFVTVHPAMHRSGHNIGRPPDTTPSGGDPGRGAPQTL
ncbi:hypothetical protein PUN28_008808 [Cardiocondyla obscurior]|uniref:Uncharacterized protein n=1 Tax=Cardiocondyla obscurior TaxID=286306 RepID=A0AAW2FSC8_9HYME